MSATTVNVFERMARIQDALFGLEQAESLAAVGHTAAFHSSEVTPDMPNVLNLIETLIRDAREGVEALVDEVRAATKPDDFVEAPIVAKRKQKKVKR